MEFETVELREDPERNWRHSFQDGVRRMALQLRKDRWAGDERREWLHGSRVRVCDMSNEDIERCAWDETRKALDRAIIERDRYGRERGMGR